MGRKIVYVIGVFDLFHRGHVELLRRARALGDKLIVAINGDEMVAKYKRRPYLSQTDRLAIVQSCRYVDEAFIIEDFDNKEAILKYGINTIVHGDDWVGNSYLEQICLTSEFVKEHEIELVYLSYTNGISTSDLIGLIKERK
jgi:glycerol-3-phosphate cytidylyltransferase